jgi:hypothetical protein
VCRPAIWEGILSRRDESKCRADAAAGQSGGGVDQYEYQCSGDPSDVQTADLSFAHLHAKVFSFTLPSHAQPNKLLEVCMPLSPSRLSWDQ